MRGVRNVTFKEVCARIEDPRADREHKFDFVELLFMTMIAVLCGATSYKEIVKIADAKLEWLRKYLQYTNGIPCATTLRNVFCRLDPEKVHYAFTEWMQGALEKIRSNEVGAVVAFDGKTAKGSRTREQKPLHVVTAFVSAAKLSVGQVSCDAKSNEITAVPELLDMLDIHGCLVIIDAMGTQKDIAEKVVSEGGDYLLQVKDNQKYLAGALKDAFE